MAAQQRPVVVIEEEKRGCFQKGIALSLAGFSTFWLLNFTMGIVEIPDNLPFIGNLDEAAAAWLLFSSLSYLGVNIIPNPNRASRFSIQKNPASE